jgi:hypothetical protein
MDKPKSPHFDKFSFCETAGATGMSLWHIRNLTKAGRKLGGGADALSLCGRKVCWDLDVDLTEHHLKLNTCSRCSEIFPTLLSILEEPK